MCLAQGHNAITQVRLETVAPRVSSQALYHWEMRLKDPLCTPSQLGGHVREQHVSLESDHVTGHKIWTGQESVAGKLNASE